MNFGPSDIGILDHLTNCLIESLQVKQIIHIILQAPIELAQNYSFILVDVTCKLLKNLKYKLM